MKTLRLLFKHQDSRKQILFTLGLLLLIQIGSHIPTPGVNREYMKALIESNASLSLLNAMTGQALGNLALFALSVTPYITASIVIQLLTIAIPSLEKLPKEDKDKYERIMVITGAVMGYIEALSMAIGLGRSGLLSTSHTILGGIAVTLLWGTCAMLTVLIGKAIDKKGIGNGISLILLFNIVSSIPSDVGTIYEKAVTHTGILAVLFLIIALIVIVALFAFCVFLNSAEKKIPIQYSRGASKYTGGGMASTIPMKVCISGVYPVIFASTILSIPSLITAFGGNLPHWLSEISTSSSWFNFSHPVHFIGYLIYAMLVVFFGYFYAGISFNPLEIADNLKKNGGTIPGVRPGKPTSDYLQRQLKYLTLIGSLGLLVIATVPLIAAGAFGLTGLSLGGTSVIIICGVVLETRDTFVAESVSARAYTGKTFGEGFLLKKGEKSNG